MWALGLRRSLARSVSSSSNLAYRHVVVGRTTTTFNNRGFAVSMSRSFMRTALDMKEAAKKSTTATKEKSAAAPAGDKKKASSSADANAKKKPMTEEEKEKLKAKKEKIEEKRAQAKAKKAELQEKIRARKKEQAMKVKAERREKAARARERAKKRRERLELAAKAKKMRLSKENLRCPVSPPVAAYQHFMGTAYKSYRADGVTLDRDAAKKIFSDQTARWKEMSPEEQAKYADPDYDAKMKEYMEKRQEWRKSLRRGQIIALRKSRKPGTLNVYSQYVRENFPKEKTGQSFAEITKELGVKFRSLSEEEKQPYKIRAAEAREKSKESTANAA